MSDTIRSEALEDFIYQGHFNTNPDSAIFYAKVLFDFNEKTNNEIGKVNALQLEFGFNLRMKSKARSKVVAGLAKTIDAITSKPDNC